jgi:hypothetical protein
MSVATLLILSAQCTPVVGQTQLAVGEEGTGDGGNLGLGIWG